MRITFRARQPYADIFLKRAEEYKLNTNEVLITPDFDCGLDWAKGHYDSIHGTIYVQWKKEDGNVILELEIPVNVTAQLKLGKDIKIVGSGKHIFCC